MKLYVVNDIRFEIHRESWILVAIFRLHVYLHPIDEELCVKI